jgi:hypothetical protein
VFTESVKDLIAAEKNRGQSIVQTAALLGTNRRPENNVTETVRSSGQVLDKSMADSSRRLLLLLLL